MTVLEAAENVLREARKSLHYREIARRILRKKLLRTKGKTFENTVFSAISKDIKNKGKSSVFVKVDSATFGLRELGAIPKRRSSATKNRRQKVKTSKSESKPRALPKELKRLQKHLNKCLPKLQGSWIKNNGYEKHFARLIKAELEKKRQHYWDCIWQGIPIELKKGNIWLNLLRYSELLTNPTRESHKPVVTLFIDYDKRSSKITEICAVTEKKLTNALLSKKLARELLRIRDKFKDKLLNNHNWQVHLTYGQVRKIREFCVQRGIR